MGEERVMFTLGCQLEWETLPPPDAPLTIGIDSGYVRDREGNNHKAGNFEVIVGKSMPHEGPNKRFGFVNGYDTRPKRRLFELLKSQGMQFNQPVTFLSDGGDTVRDLQLYLNPEAEHLLDWFHITMRLTVLSQLSKGLPTAKPKPKPKKGSNKPLSDELDELAWPKSEEILKKLERVKWYIWHSNVYQALSNLEDLEMELSPLEEHYGEINKLYLKLEEFIGYIRSNQKFIVNYGDRYRNQETISSAFVESTVNEVTSPRFVKKQQMRWTKAGVHLLLQVRTKVLEEEWRAIYSRWYPGMKTAQGPGEQSKVA